MAFGLCPWAEPSLRAGRVARSVCLSPEPTPAECLSFIDRIVVADAPALDIGLLLFPRYTASSAAFDRFAERVRSADATRRSRAGHDARGTRFLVAVFHPDGATTFVGPHQLVSFVRRTPDPMLQFVRAAALDRIKLGQPDASESVTRRNHDDLLGEKAARLDEIARAIRADRDASHARLVG